MPLFITVIVLCWHTNTSSRSCKSMNEDSENLPVGLMLHSIHLVNSWSWDGNHEFTTCKWNEHFSEIVSFIIMTSSLFMFTLDSIRYEGETEFVFTVLLLYDKILSNPIKILILDTHLDYHQLPLSLITKWRTRVAWTLLEFTACGHEVNGTLFHRSWTRNHVFMSWMERSMNMCWQILVVIFDLLDMCTVLHSLAW